MLAVLYKSLGELRLPLIRKIMLKSVLLALVLFILINILVWTGLAGSSFFDLPWLESISDFLGGAFTLLISWLLFPAAGAFILSFYLEDIATAVEATQAPGLPPARAQKISEIIWIASKFSLIALLLNLVALPFYFIPGLGFLIYYLANGYLLGREYYELVALRRLSPNDASHLRSAFSGRIWLCGVMIAVLFSLPFINLIAAVISTIFMTNIMLNLLDKFEKRSAGSA